MRSLRSSLLRATVLGALGASASTPALQSVDNAADASLAPPSGRVAEDLTIPVFESMPLGGWPTAAKFAGPDPALPVEAGGQVFEAQPGQPKTHEGVAPEIASQLSIRELMTEPLVTTPGDGRVWVRTRDMRASFGNEGFTAYPVFGSASSREWPVQFAVDAITRGGESLGAEPVGAATHEGHEVTIPREGAREVYHLGLDEIEQTFVFDTLPGAGDLVVRMDVETDLSVMEDPSGLRFVHDTFGEVRYGDAFVLDAAGRREAIERRWDGEHLTLTVPSAFLANAVLPVTIDPPVTAFTSGFGVSDDSHPDITYAGGANRYFVAWEEYTSSTNADVYMTSFTHGGTQGTSFAVETTNDHWATPRLAYVGANNRILVVASRTQDGPGTGFGAITGQLVNASNSTLVGLNFFVSTTGSYKYQPDVGGTNRTSTVNTHFLVAWSRQLNSTTRSIEYRVIDWDGSPVTTVVPVANTSGEDALQPAVSESTGDDTLLGDWWTLAWIRDTGSDGRGEVWARRVVWSGSTSLGSGNFRVEGSSNCANPTVTSRLDEDLPGIGDRPSIVAYDIRFSAGTGFQRSIYGRVVTDGQAYGSNAINTTLEDFDFSLDQFSPNLGTDGDGFVMTYSEGYWNNASDFDMYMVSGHIAVVPNDFLLGLAERHENMAFTSSPEYQGRVAMQQDGNNALTNDDGACIWMRELSGNGGQLRGYTVDINTTDVADEGSIGVQYCDANPNSVGSGGGRNSSWLWIRGNQRRTSTHRAHCVDMPQNSFGYLNCSMSSGNVNMPGTSVGRLCLGGSIGRFAGNIQFSGTSGQITTSFSPLSLPQPTGNVAAQAGQTWYFQVWHRDTSGGTSTSNFSNGCRVMFTN